MPITIVVHEIRKEARVVSCQNPAITIGREAANDVVLPNVSVSRQHVKINPTVEGPYILQCLKPDNPVLLNGNWVTDKGIIKEGDAFQVGRYLLLFSLKSDAGQVYVKQKPSWNENICKGCGWRGVLGAYVKEPTCPSCGSRELALKTDEEEETFGFGQTDVATSMLGASDLQKAHTETFIAKSAAIVRQPERVGIANRFELTESKVCTFGKNDSSLPIDGMMLGKPCTIAWQNKGYLAMPGGMMPKMKVNENAPSSKYLKHGDVITIGKNTFRFVVGGL